MIKLSFNCAHVRDDGVVFPEVPLPLDGLVEECAEDDEEQHVEDAQDGQTARLGVSFGSCDKSCRIQSGSYLQKSRYIIFTTFITTKQSPNLIYLCL